jgi:hypothetical protein
MDPQGWRPISEPAPEPMTVVFYSANLTWDHPEGGLWEPPSYRLERAGLGYWDGSEWRWLGTGHSVFEFDYTPGHPDCPTHWQPLPPPPTKEASA